MKQSQIFQQYVWLISTIRRYRRMTFEELNQKWIEDQVTDGNPLQRSTFNRHRDAILNIVEGKVVFKAVADVFGLPYEPLVL